ncbi:MAG: hypothetical protein IH973_06710 [Myxococcales bacterium]|nr:hypothetical protein [Myxococcales bacterium]
MSRSHDLDETLANVIDLVAKRLDADVCSIYLCDANLQHLTLSATNGLEPGSVQKVRLAIGEGPTRDYLRRECHQSGVDYVELDTSMPFDRALMEYLISRKARC